MIEKRWVVDQYQVKEISVDLTDAAAVWVTSLGQSFRVDSLHETEVGALEAVHSNLAQVIKSLARQQEQTLRRLMQIAPHWNDRASA